MNDASSNNSTSDQMSSQNSSSPVSQQQSSQEVSQQVSPSNPPQPQSSFNEQDQWNEIQTKLATHDQNLQARIQGQDGQGGIVSDSYERRMREMRQKLYEGFIKSSLDHHLQKQDETLNKVQALQNVLKDQSVLTQQAGRDKVFRDDLIKEVERRLDMLSNNPFDGAEAKLEALASIYTHAATTGAEQGGVTDNWKKRILREARRKYAMSLLSSSQDKLDKWTQKDSDLSRYLKSLMVKEQPQATPQPEQVAKVQVPYISASSIPTSRAGTSSTGQQLNQPQPSTAEQPTPAIPAIPHYQTMDSASTQAQSISTEEKENEPEKEVPQPSDSGTISSPPPPPVQPQPSATPTQEEEPTPSVTPSSPEPVLPLGTVIPAPEKEQEQSEEKKEPSTTPVTPLPSQQVPQAEQVQSQQQSSTAPGQSFTDFLTSRAAQNKPVESQETSPSQTQSTSSQATPFGSSQPEAQPSQPLPSTPSEPSVTPPFSPTPENISVPPQQNTSEQESEQPEPEKKKGFFSKLFGK